MRIRTQTAARVEVVGLLLVLLALGWQMFLEEPVAGLYSGAKEYEVNERLEIVFRYMQALRNTAEISVWVTVLSLALGYPLAYLMTVVSGRVRTLLIVLVLVPFWTSVLVRTFAWMVILGKRGIINQLLIGCGVIDKGVNVNLPYSGNAPDLGAFEIGLP